MRLKPSSTGASCSNSLWVNMPSWSVLQREHTSPLISHGPAVPWPALAPADTWAREDGAGWRHRPPDHAPSSFPCKRVSDQFPSQVTQHCHKEGGEGHQGPAVGFAVRRQVEAHFSPCPCPFPLRASKGGGAAPLGAVSAMGSVHNAPHSIPCLHEAAASFQELGSRTLPFRRPLLSPHRAGCSRAGTAAGTGRCRASGRFHLDTEKGHLGRVVALQLPCLWSLSPPGDPNPLPSAAPASPARGRLLFHHPDRPPCWPRPYLGSCPSCGGAHLDWCQVPPPPGRVLYHFPGLYPRDHVHTA